MEDDVIDGRFLSGCGASENIFITRQFCDWSFSSPPPSFLGVLTYMDGWDSGIDFNASALAYIHVSPYTLPRLLYAHSTGAILVLSSITAPWKFG